MVYTRGQRGVSPIRDSMIYETEGHRFLVNNLESDFQSEQRAVNQLTDRPEEYQSYFAKMIQALKDICRGWYYAKRTA
jgi:hypothetical protein